METILAFTKCRTWLRLLTSDPTAQINELDEERYFLRLFAT